MPERFSTRVTRRRGPEAVRRHAVPKAILAVLIIVAGVASFLAPTMTAVPSVRLVGAIVMMAGLMHVAAAIANERPLALTGSLGLGLAYVGIGGLFVADPQVSIRVLSLVLATAQLLIGLNKAATALRERGEHWGWALALGLLLVTLGTLVAIGWPDSGLVAIGRFVGINLVVEGVSWLAILWRTVAMARASVTIAPVNQPAEPVPRHRP